MLKTSISYPHPSQKNNLSVCLLNNYLCMYFFHLQYRINHTLSNLKRNKTKQKKILASFLLLLSFITHKIILKVNKEKKHTAKTYTTHCWTMCLSSSPNLCSSPALQRTGDCALGFCASPSSVQLASHQMSHLERWPFFSKSAHFLMVWFFFFSWLSKQLVSEGEQSLCSQACAQQHNRVCPREGTVLLSQLLSLQHCKTNPCVSKWPFFPLKCIK